MTLSFKKWFEVGGGLEPVKSEPDLPYAGRKFPPGQTHAMQTYSGLGSDELPPVNKKMKKMKSKCEKK